MSLECSECERDLRGGHDPSCSRSKGWIKCGLPWSYYGNLEDIPKAPSLRKQIKKQFGKTEFEAYKELTALLGGAKFATPEYEKITKSKKYKTALKDYRKFIAKISEWHKSQPAWFDYQKSITNFDAAEKNKSFCGRKLNKPGTLIEVLDNKELKQFLIGDINNLGGVCDDCMGFSKDAIVVRYKNGC